MEETSTKNLQKTTTKYTYITLTNIKQPKRIVTKPTYKKVYKENIKPAIRQKNKKVKSVFNKKKEFKKNLIKQKILQINKPVINYIKPIRKDIVKKVKKKPIMDLAKEYKELQLLDSLTRNYIKLYGNEYFKLSEEQREYLKTNLNSIGQITQKHLRYPSIAVRTKQSGTNVVEFILKSNGDIIDLKITDSSKYNSLDKNTIKTIKIAYKDYPRPKEDTKVKIFVKYLLY